MTDFAGRVRNKTMPVADMLQEWRVELMALPFSLSGDSSGPRHLRDMHAATAGTDRAAWAALDGAIERYCEGMLLARDVSLNCLGLLDERKTTLQSTVTLLLKQYDFEYGIQMATEAREALAASILSDMDAYLTKAIRKLPPPMPDHRGAGPV